MLFGWILAGFGFDLRDPFAKAIAKANRVRVFPLSQTREGFAQGPRAGLGVSLVLTAIQTRRCFSMR